MNGPCVEVALAGAVEPEVAADVLNYFSPTEGRPADSFHFRLLRAFDHADVENRARLRAGFPAYALAFHIAKEHDLGTDALRSIAARTTGV